MLAEHSLSLTDTQPNELGEDRFRGSRVVPTQFGIQDLFILIALAALVFAFLVPILKHFEIEHVIAGVAAFGIQFASASATFVALAIRRNRMLRRSGQRIGFAYSGDAAWKYWPIARCLMMFAGAGVAQFAISLFFVFRVEAEFSPILLLYSLQIGYFFGASISQMHWRSYPGFIEFFENGITVDGRSLTPWKRVSMRESRIFPDRIVLVSDATNIARSRVIHTAQVSKSLRKQLTQFAPIEPWQAAS